MIKYKEFFGFIKEPFACELKIEEILETPQVKAAQNRIRFAVEIGAVSLITGEVGSGKSTALRYAMAQLHPSRYKIVPIVACSGTFLEILRQINFALESESCSNSTAFLMNRIKNIFFDIYNKKQTPVLVIDEASLIRVDIFKQIHTLTYFDYDSKPLLPIILVGQTNLLDNLIYHTSASFSSRVVGKTHLVGLQLKDMEQYLLHHLHIAGVNENIFTPDAITAIHQASGGLLRKANNIAKGALVAAYQKQQQQVCAEHVRLAVSELL